MADTFAWLVARGYGSVIPVAAGSPLADFSVDGVEADDSSDIQCILTRTEDDGSAVQGLGSANVQWNAKTLSAHIASPTVPVREGGTASISVSLQETNLAAGSQPTFRWRAGHGTIVGEGSVVTYRAPPVFGGLSGDTVAVTVLRDGEIAHAQAAVDFDVAPPRVGIRNTRITVEPSPFIVGVRGLPVGTLVPVDGATATIRARAVDTSRGAATLAVDWNLNMLVGGAIAQRRVVFDSTSVSHVLPIRLSRVEHTGVRQDFAVPIVGQILVSWPPSGAHESEVGSFATFNFPQILLHVTLDPNR